MAIALGYEWNGLLGAHPGPTPINKWVGA